MRPWCFFNFYKTSQYIWALNVKFLFITKIEHLSIILVVIYILCVWVNSFPSLNLFHVSAFTKDIAKLYRYNMRRWLTQNQSTESSLVIHSNLMVISTWREKIITSKMAIRCKSSVTQSNMLSKRDVFGDEEMNPQLRDSSSSRGLRFSFQHLRQLTTNCNSSLRWFYALFWPPVDTAHSWCRHTYRQNAQTHKVKKIKQKKT